MDGENILERCPDSGSGWKVDWESLERDFPWLGALDCCPQDPEFHGEGSVLNHTRAVIQYLVEMPLWRRLSLEKRKLAFAAALMHDIGKPATTRYDGNRIHSYGHSLKGAQMARVILWDMDVPFQCREAVCSIIRNHTKPFWLLENDERMKRTALQIMLDTDIEMLSAVVMADNHGRQCEGRDATAENLELAFEYMKELTCACAPESIYPMSSSRGPITSCSHIFSNEESRFRFFRNPELREPYNAFPSHRCTVFLLSGLPGAGKDHWIEHSAAEGLPVISLDKIRAETGARPSGDQRAVISAAKEKARELLRTKQGFIWNATNLSRQIRDQLTDLCADYEARIEIVYLDCSRRRLYEQNRNRSQSVPENVIEKLLSRWEIPDFTEAHSVSYICR